MGYRVTSYYSILVATFLMVVLQPSSASVEASNYKPYPIKCQELSNFSDSVYISCLSYWKEVSQIHEVGLPAYQVVLVILSVLGFAFSLLNIFRDYKNRRQDLLNSVRDSYWLREIIFPKLIRPLDEKILSSEFRYKKYEDIEDHTLDGFIEKLDDLKDEFSLAELISSSLYLKIENDIDNLGIIISNRAKPGEVYNTDEEDRSAKDPFLDCYKKVLKKLMEAHSNEIKTPWS